MKKVTDNFSRQAKIYKKYRPIYPKELFQEIIELTKHKHQCWDCGTGNGQVAVELSKYFDKVYATDISQEQLDHAERKSNITYKVERAEKTSFTDNKFDLITVGQAVHWFDFDEFNQEVKRVAKNGGIISIWGYGLLRIDQAVNQLIDQFYYDIIGPYWNKERKHIDQEYKSINFDFKEIKSTNKQSIIVNWELEQLKGYFNSWSSVQNYQQQNNNENPVDEIIQQIGTHWDQDEMKEIEFPIFMRIGEINK